MQGRSLGSHPEKKKKRTERAAAAYYEGEEISFQTHFNIGNLLTYKTKENCHHYQPPNIK